MFVPPRCPNESCSQHTAPEGRFFRRHGFYSPMCRSHPVPRFLCMTCRKSFSRQTFRADYHDNKPHLNVSVVKYITSGVGLRKTARNLGLTRKNLELKWRKLAKHGRRLDLNLKSRAARAEAHKPPSEPFRIQFDELETYETRQNTRPLSIATLVEVRTRLIVGAIAAPIRPKGTMTKQRIRAILREDSLFGRRKDRSRVSCRSVFRSAAKLRPGASQVLLETDEKVTYPAYFDEAFHGVRRSHTTTSSKAPRGAGTPLFPINLNEAILRDHAGRVRRDSWLVSKRRAYLNQHLAFYASWKNWVLPRFNRDQYAPGVLAGMAPRNLSIGEFLGWRQVWGRRSPCPFGNGRRSMDEALECPLVRELQLV
jgi:transposase-like protein